MDPPQNQRDQLNNTDPNNPRNDSSSENTSRNSATEQRPQYLNGYTVFPPNETLRNDLRTSAQREVERLETFREAQRSAPVHMTPERLGGTVTMAEAREQQSKVQRNIKLQKRMKREEETKRKKEEEERKQQEMKNIQRKKAEQQEWKRKQEDDRRTEQLAEHRRSVIDRMQQQQQQLSSARGEMNEAAAKTSDVPKVKMSLEEQQLKHKRTNAAFLDKLDQRNTANGESSSPSQSPPEPICSGRTAGDCGTDTASGPDYEWALMKLMSHFPHFNKDVLNNILSECNGDYEQAYELLSP